MPSERHLSTFSSDGSGSDIDYLDEPRQAMTRYEEPAHMMLAVAVALRRRPLWATVSQGWGRDSTAETEEGHQLA